MLVAREAKEPRVYVRTGEVGEHHYSVIDMGYLNKKGLVVRDKNAGTRLTVKKKAVKDIDPANLN